MDAGGEPGMYMQQIIIFKIKTLIINPILFVQE